MGLFDWINSKWTQTKNSQELLGELEDRLIQNDFGPDLAHKLAQSAKNLSKKYKNVTPETLQEAMVEELFTILAPYQEGWVPEVTPQELPQVILVSGVNGSGKTTTVAKLAYFLKHTYNRNVACIAADTFRAAATEQLLIWGQRLSIPIYQGSLNKDPSAVIYESFAQAHKDKSETLIIDTAGRIHNNSN